MMGDSRHPSLECVCLAYVCGARLTAGAGGSRALACSSKQLALKGSRLGRKIVQVLCTWLSLSEALCPHLLVMSPTVFSHQPGAPTAWVCCLGPVDCPRPLSPNVIAGTVRPSGHSLLCGLPQSLPHPGPAGPQTSGLCPPPVQRALYLVYRPFFRQKEFLTDSLRLLSSRAGKLLSSKLIISPWPRAPALALFPGRGRGGGDRIQSPMSPFRPLVSLPPPGQVAHSLSRYVRPNGRWRLYPGALGCSSSQGRRLSRRERTPGPTLPKQRQTRLAGGAWSQLTRVCLLGVLLALASDNEHEDQEEDEDEAHEGNDHQEPPLLVERVGLLG